MSEAFRKNNRYQLERIIDGNRTVLAEFKRTSVGLFAPGDVTVTLSESECFSLASGFNSQAPLLSAYSQQKHNLETAGIRIQARKIKLGFSLDTPRNPGVDAELSRQ
jgi:choline dehydrogenase-like flavoprotein